MEELLHTLVMGAASLGITLTGQQEHLFSTFLEELLLWNRRINLIAEASPAEIVVRHFLDSLTPAPFIVRKDGNLLDIGTGGGLPGIPLKIAVPALRVYLLEASRKKTSFLKHIIRRLPLEGATVIDRRVEQTLQEEMYRSRFDTVVSRAALKLPDLTALAGYFLAPGGVLIAMKGPHIEGEIEDASPIAASAGLLPAKSHLLVLPFTESLRKIVVYRKS